MLSRSSEWHSQRAAFGLFFITENFILTARVIQYIFRWFAVLQNRRGRLISRNDSGRAWTRVDQHFSWFASFPMNSSTADSVSFKSVSDDESTFLAMVMFADAIWLNISWLCWSTSCAKPVSRRRNWSDSDPDCFVFWQVKALRELELEIDLIVLKGQLFSITSLSANVIPQAGRSTLQ
jgi:hypothetical protein